MTSRRTLALLALPAVAALTLAGCAGGSDAGGASPEGGT